MLSKSQIKGNLKDRRTQHFADLCRRFNLAIEQADRAEAAGYCSVAEGTRNRAQALLTRIKQHLREDQQAEARSLGA